MLTPEINLLNEDNTLIVAPAGCGKSQILVDNLKNLIGSKPILILTHTNAGVASLKSKLIKSNIHDAKFKLYTIDGFAIRLVRLFSKRAQYSREQLLEKNINYTEIREALLRILKGAHINDVLQSNYSQVFVDEYQDCSTLQHQIILQLSLLLPTCVVGDPLQAIFGFDPKDPLPNWNLDVCPKFSIIRNLNKPWRWINTECDILGEWLLEVRIKLLKNESIDLHNAPSMVSWISLSGDSKQNQKNLIEACNTKAPNPNGSVLIIGDSKNPSSQKQFARVTPGAIAIESVEMKDLIAFANRLDLTSKHALECILDFAESVMTNIGKSDFMSRVSILSRASGRKLPTEAELAALKFLAEPTYSLAGILLSALNQQAGVRVFRLDILKTCIRAMDGLLENNKTLFLESILIIREQSRFRGRLLPKRAVGSTLLLKGLEADVAVILNADELNSNNLYVALTRGSRRLVICSKSHILHG
jgi:DNA helicase-2/ATP-dependent DNA helicase PcrA